MTNEERIIVDRFRAKGHGYKKIAAETGISANTIKSYLRKAPMPASDSPVNAPPSSSAEDAEPADKSCDYCGNSVPQIPGRKIKRFCCDECRMRWWSNHMSLVDRKAVYHYTCPACGKEFSVYGNAHRKYCSHACYIADRFGGAK